MYNKKKSTTEVWAVVNESGEVLTSCGGLSSSVRLLVYDSELKAKLAMTNDWIKHFHKDTDMRIIKIYSNG